jgi:Domain of unknown function (DUF4296)
MKKLTVFFFIIIFSCSDKNKIPKDILQKEKMQEVLWGMISAGEYLDGYVLKKDSIDQVIEKAKIYNHVFQVYHITKEGFDKSYKYYKEHPDMMKKILDSLSKRLTFPIGQPQPRDTAKKKLIETEAVQ